MARGARGFWTTALVCLALSLVLQACVPQQGVKRQPMAAAPAPVIVSFAAHPPGLTEGGTTTLKWQTRDAVSVNISGVGDVPPTGSRVVEPRGRSNYLLTASNRDGQMVSEEIRIGLKPLMGQITMPPMIFFFKAEPPHVMAGDTTTLTWRVENAERVEISGLGQVPPSGSRSVEPREQSHFQLSAIGSDGKRSTAELMVGIAQPMVIEPPPRRFEQPVVRPPARLERPVIAPAQSIEQPEIRRIQPNDRRELRAIYPATMQALRILATPAQQSPRDGSRFSHHPRQTRLQWAPVEGAASYTVEVDCYQCCRSNAWCTDIGKAYKVQPSLRATSYNFNFAGAQPGRWRVWAVDKNGRAGAKSGWWKFSYTR
jgi:hypothetical protein